MTSKLLGRILIGNASEICRKNLSFTVSSCVYVQSVASQIGTKMGVGVIVIHVSH